MGNAYLDLVRGYLAARDLALPLPGASSVTRPSSDGQRPAVLIFAPHPDDEVIMGALPLRLQEELGWRVVDVAVTLGSKVSRQKEREEELAGACRFLGWESVVLGWTEVMPEGRERDPVLWAERVGRVAALIDDYGPVAVFVPHEDDGHPAHCGVSLLVREALLQARGQPTLFLTEYWHPMFRPNLLVACSEEEVARLVEALAVHGGEVARNPYHRTLPAWMIENVRRGAERVGGAGTEAPTFPFGVLYRMEPERPEALAPFVEGHLGALADYLTAKEIPTPPRRDPQS
jgi:LmbE family N-acetylglucosaminyl deacetylase